MRISLDWLRTLCDSGLDAAALADLLTRQGLEVGGVWPVPAPSERIVAGSLAEVRPLPRTNLKTVMVEAGDAGRYAVVSAAPNVACGMLGALALPGATLPDGRVIGAREYAGHRSEAMLCSAAEIGLGEVSDRLLELPPEAVPGVPLAQLYGLPDTCFEVELTPNRGDCLSLIGMAREVYAGTGAPLVLPSTSAVPAKHDGVVAVRLREPEACPRYLGRVVSHLRPHAKSPLWLTERLRRAGLRAAYPVVDVLNYVMLELGQPLHAFDHDALHGEIEVRMARQGERLVLLGGVDAALDPDMLVIADAEAPVAVAGIMGGAGSAVGAQTRSVFLESAFFRPAVVRGRARRLGLTTEAAHRFERGVDPNLPAAALERATALICEIAGGLPGPIMVAESAADLPRARTLSFRPSSVKRLVGVDMPAAAMQSVFSRLGFQTSAGGKSALDVTIPTARFDIEGEADLVEEIIRIEGFERVPEVAPARRLSSPATAAGLGVEGRMKAMLSAHGFDEALNMSFTDAQRDTVLAWDSARELVLRNPLSEHESVLRRSLWPGLLEALAYNVARQANRVRLFEAGTVFDARTVERRHLAAVACGTAAPEQWGVEARSVDFFDVKGEVEALLGAAGLRGVVYRTSEHPALAAGRGAKVLLGDTVYAEFGVLAPRLAALWGLPPETVMLEIDLMSVPAPAPARATAVPRFPAMRRDLALVVPERVDAATVVSAVQEHGGPRLAEVRIFDTYTGSGIPFGARGLALGLIFRDLSRTLTDAEVDAAVSAIVAGLGEGMGAYVRS